MDMSQFLWIAVLGGIGGFGYGFLIGANDVANAFASSVAAKSVTLKQAVIIAAICEFSGAFFLGASVTGTIRSKIIDVDLYEDEPDILMYGMFSALVGACIMLYTATHFGLPVSTTHDIVGSIMGFSIAAKGFDSIQWDNFKKIVVSWFASPLLAGAVSFCLFGSVKYFVMTTEDPYQRAYYTFPIVLTIGIGIDLFYVLYKASSNFSGIQDELSLSWVLPFSFGTGAVAGVFWIFVFGPCAKRRIEAAAAARGTMHSMSKASVLKASFKEPGYEEDEEADTEKKGLGNDEDLTSEEEEAAAAAAAGKEDNDPAPLTGWRSLAKKFGDNTVNQDLHEQSMHENPRAAKIWEDAEHYDENAESLFNYIQVFTAALNSFAHGANDVSNTIAPLSAIIHLYQTGEVSSKTTVQKWVLAYGGIAIVIGLLCYGYRVMKSLGYKLTFMSASRGASAELAASLVVVTASFLSLPVSSTQCIVGAVSGIGLVGGPQNVQWLFLLRVCSGWAVLYVCAVIVSAGVFAYGAFSPSLVTV
jgi:sodium-dependent phosphate transporter